MKEEWGPWTEHNSACCPVAKNTYVEVEGYARSNMWQQPRIKISQGYADPAQYMWVRLLDNVYPMVIRYRVRKPRGLQILQKLIENLPAPNRVKEKT